MKFKKLEVNGRRLRTEKGYTDIPGSIKPEGRLKINPVVLSAGMLIAAALLYFAFYRVVRDLNRRDCLRRCAGIVFLAVMAGILVYPASAVDSNKMSVEEYRTLATGPDLFSDGKLNWKFGPLFEEFFSDHFRSRDKLISLYKKLRLVLNGYKEHAPDGTFIGRSGWICQPVKENYSEEQIARCEKNLSALKKWCDRHNINLYVSVCPDRTIVYREYSYCNYRHCDAEFFERLTRRLEESTGVTISWPFRQMEEGKKRYPAYFQTDHHWTEWGAYLGYRDLMDIIRKDFPDYRASMKPISTSG
ncbi:MAG: hypothetical protein MJ016_00085 [Victivallaceae bacterium]|nr:hypothetical protein [Victivallaceae bacterium]